MKISEVTITNLKNYAKVEHTEDDTLFTAILTAIKAHILSYTGLDADAADLEEDLTMVLFVLSNEMYENRQYTVQNDKVNVVIKSILDKHSINLL